VIPNLKLVSVNTVTGESFEEDAGAVLLPEDYATLEQLNRKLRRENAALRVSSRCCARSIRTPS